VPARVPSGILMALHEGSGSRGCTTAGALDTAVRLASSSEATCSCSRRWTKREPPPAFHERTRSAAESRKRTQAHGKAP
jgi:hypothetical protein